MGLEVIEVLAVILIVCALVCNCAAIGIPLWLTDKSCGLEIGCQTHVYELFQRCTRIYYDILSHISCESYRDYKTTKGGQSKRFLQATGALVVVALLANVAAVFLITLYVLVPKVKLKIIKILAILTAFVAGFCAVSAFAVWYIKWTQLGADVTQFGAGLWMALVTGILSLIASVLSLRFKGSQTV